MILNNKYIEQTWIYINYRIVFTILNDKYVKQYLRCSTVSILSNLPLGYISTHDVSI